MIFCILSGKSTMLFLFSKCLQDDFWKILLPAASSELGGFRLYLSFNTSPSVGI
jgi:hypothetical protein